METWSVEFCSNQVPQQYQERCDLLGERETVWLGHVGGVICWGGDKGEMLLPGRKPAKSEKGVFDFRREPGRSQFGMCSTHRHRQSLPWAGALLLTQLSVSARWAHWALDAFWLSGMFPSVPRWPRLQDRFSWQDCGEVLAGLWGGGRNVHWPEEVGVSNNLCTE